MRNPWVCVLFLRQWWVFPCHTSLKNPGSIAVTFQQAFLHFWHCFSLPFSGASVLGKTKNVCQRSFILYHLTTRRKAMYLAYCSRIGTIWIWVLYSFLYLYFLYFGKPFDGCLRTYGHICKACFDISFVDEENMLMKQNGIYIDWAQVQWQGLHCFEGFWWCVFLAFIFLNATCSCR